MIVGLTGGIATGKSTVSSMLRELGAFVVDADVWARKVVEPGTEGLREVVARFGPGVLNPDGSLNRRALAEMVFQDEAARNDLNAIVHPRVRAGMMAETKARLKLHPHDPVVWDVPLLFEGPTRDMVDVTVLVYAPEEVQLRRIMARDGLDERAARLRIKAQMPIEEKRRLADFVIDNSHSLDETKEQVQRVWEVIRAAAARR
ncbi:dephospho-CoA kinase [Alicyclobacillus cellulosilyticus]|uniref:Dephospho-CoA kinase n=1 Tax=Alicyclobacillus cellulosilyticus TaxID=1003997 RepID=A0A917NPN8_9BACL|nr:dephospho-CoA kinase [Alicyclobacillus cellulosilyticus]GGJ13437.1 dephospho-CoA kinase [Alicyclobacillus cellulosilyticus]